MCTSQARELCLELAQPAFTAAVTMTFLPIEWKRRAKLSPIPLVPPMMSIVLIEEVMW